MFVRFLETLVIMTSTLYLSHFAEELAVSSTGYCGDGQGVVVSGILKEPLQLMDKDVALVTHSNGYYNRPWCEILGQTFVRCRINIFANDLTFYWSIFHGGAWKNSSNISLYFKKTCTCYGTITKTSRVNQPISSVKLKLDTSSFRLMSSYISHRNVSVYSKFSYKSRYHLVRKTEVTKVYVKDLMNSNNNNRIIRSYITLHQPDFDLVCPTDILLVITRKINCSEIMTLLNYNYSTEKDLTESLHCSYSYRTEILTVSSSNLYSSYLYGVNVFADNVLHRKLKANVTSSSALHLEELEQNVHLQFVYHGKCDGHVTGNVTCIVESVEKGIPLTTVSSNNYDYETVLFVLIGVGLPLLFALIIGAYCYQIKSRRYVPPTDYVDERILQLYSGDL